MCCQERYTWEPFKLRSTYTKQWDRVGDSPFPTKDCQKKISKIPVQLFGDVDLIDVIVNDSKCKGLLDSGSCISTVAKWFYDESLSTIPMKTLSESLNIEVAGGGDLQYLGLIEIDISLPEIDPVVTFPTPVLVVDNTNFSKKSPFVIGKNIINPCMKFLKQRDGEQFLQKVNLSDSWRSAFQCNSLRVKPSSGKLGQVICHRQVVIPPNSTHTITGSTRSCTLGKTLVMTDVEEFTQLPAGLMIDPILQEVDFPNKTHKKMNVQISNLTNSKITIPSNSTLCNIHAVSLVSPSDSFCLSDQELLQQFTLGPSLSEEERSQVFSLLHKWKDIFSTGDTDMGRTDVIKHKINLTDEIPFREAHRRIPPNMYEEVRRHIKDMLQSNVIQESCSPYASPVVLVKKPDGSLRFCIDYRKLNSKTIKNAHPLPRIDETLDSLLGSKYFSTLDLKAGYWQIEMEEQDKPKTAFTVGPLGFYEWNVMPFGLANAPATFQYLMQKTMGDLHLSQCLLYIDDIIIFSSSFEEHLQRLEAVFQRLKKAGLKLKPSKCHLFHEKVKYLGHIISSDGIETDPSKIEALKHWPTPSSVQDMRRFLGFAGYYRRFVSNFAQISRPLHDLLKGDIPSKRCQRKQPEIPFHWCPVHQESFDHIIDLLCHTPVLSFADYSKPFVLHTDASKTGLGAVLYQSVEGKERPIAYASRSLKSSETNYSTHKLEFLALKWAVTDKFKEYLYGAKFKVRTDNNPLCYILSTARLDATGQRWVSELANFDFTVEYRSGKKNKDADFLSRIPISNTNSTDPSFLPQSVVKAICEFQLPQFLGSNICYTHCPPYDELGCDQLSPYDIRTEQLKDDILSAVIRHLEQGHQLCSSKKPNSELRFYIQKIDQFVIHQNVLCRKRFIDGSTHFQLVLPCHLRNYVLHALHDEVGHMGRDRTLQLVQDRYFWPKMSQHVAEYISVCSRCLRRKTPINQKAPLVNITSSAPLEILCIDYLTLEPSKGNIENVLVVTDHFTKYSRAFPCKSQKARPTAKILFDHFICHYGFPQRIHSDQGRNFVSKLFHEMCKMAGISKSRTSPYHAMGNGLVERYNRTLINMLGCLDPKKKADWKNHLNAITHAYNCTKHEATGYSPFFLMYGRHPRLPIDIILGLASEENEENFNYTKFVENLRKTLKTSYKVAQERSKVQQDRHKVLYDRKIRGSGLHPGDRVLVRNVNVRGKHKLADLWEEPVYIVVDQPCNEIPVFKVRKEVQKEKEKQVFRTLHRNLLLPVNHLPLDVPDEPASIQTSDKPQLSKKKEFDIQSPSETESDDNSDSLLISYHPVEIPLDPVANPENGDLTSNHVSDDLSDNHRDLFEPDNQTDNLAEDLTDHSSLSEHSSSSKEEEHQASPPFLRRSTRQRHPPNWHKDYVK